MSGVDTNRGISFQGAVALLRAVDLLEDPARGAALRVEGLDDIADIETFGTAGMVLRTIQAKSKAEPGTWARADIVGILGQWGGEGDTFEFITDGTLGPSGVTVRQALSDLQASESSEKADQLVTDVALVQGAGEAAARDRLRRCGITSRAGKIEDLLLRCEYRLLVLLQRQQPGVSADDSTSVVDRLWRELTLAAGRPDPGDRMLTRDRLAGLCGLDLEVLDRSERWTAKAAADFLAATAAEPAAVVAVRIRPFNPSPQALSSGGHDPLANDAIGIDELPQSGEMLIVGATGSGKSMACRELARLRAAARAFAAVVDDRSYIPGQLLPSVADVVAAACGIRPLEGQVAELLRDPAAALIIDGASELDADARQQLRDELRAARRAGLRCQIVAGGRDITALRGLVEPDAPAFWPNPWTREDRIRYATAQGTDPPTAAARINRADQILGDASGSPLLTAMALNVLAGDQEPENRAALYAASLDGLAARAGAENTDILFGWVGAAFARLLAQGQRQAGRLTWARTLSETLRVLADNGVETAMSPTDALDEAIRIGILVKPLPFASIGALHDSFGDYLAAVATFHHLAAVPGLELASQEDQVIFLCEIGGVTAGIAARAAAAAPLTAVKIASLDSRATEERDEKEVVHLLRFLVEGTVLAEIMTGPIRVRPQGGYVRASWPTAGGTERSVLVPALRGPLNAAVAVWGALLRDTMRPEVPSEFLPRAQTAGEGAERLVSHETETQRELARMVADLIPAAARQTVLAALPPPGMEAVVYEDSDLADLGVGDQLHVAYTRTTSGISARADRPPEFRPDGQGRVMLSSILSNNPAAAAAEALAAALARETDGRWPR